MVECDISLQAVKVHDDQELLPSANSFKWFLFVFSQISKGPENMKPNYIYIFIYFNFYILKGLYKVIFIMSFAPRFILVDFLPPLSFSVSLLHFCSQSHLWWSVSVFKLTESRITLEMGLWPGLWGITLINASVGKCMLIASRTISYMRDSGKLNTAQAFISPE